MTTPPTSLEGLDLDALDRHLQSVGIARTGELRAEFISGGRSNLTFLVSDDASKWVLRRPPLHGLTPSAHDMAREYKVVAALQEAFLARTYEEWEALLLPAGDAWVGIGTSGSTSATSARTWLRTAAGSCSRRCFRF